MLKNVILYVLDFVLGLVEALILLRIALKLFGASVKAPFVTWVYETTNPLLSPFVGMFPSPKLDGVFTIEFSALFALIVYAILSYVISEFVRGFPAYRKA